MSSKSPQPLSEDEERLRLAIDAGQLGVWDWDVGNDHVEWSDRVYELHDVPLGAFGGRVADFAALVHPDDVAEVSARIQAALNEGDSFAAEFRVKLKNGGTRWLSTRAEVFRDAGGKPVRMVGSTNDVTERVELLAAERRSRAIAEQARQRLELLAKAGSVLSRSLEPHATLQAIASIVVPDIADWCRVDLLDANGEIQRALTYHSDPEKARRGVELVARLKMPRDSPGSMDWVVAHGKSHLTNLDAPVHIDPNRDRDLLTFVEAIGMRSLFTVPLVARGRIIGALGALQAESGRSFTEDDCSLISELAQRAALALDNARSYAEAEAALREAETANRAKDEFLAMLGHELRNPLAPIVTALHVMQGRDEEVGGDERRIIGRQVAHLSRLVDDLLDVSRITRGKIELDCELADMNAVIARAMELTQPALERRTRPVELDLPSAPVYVSGDVVRLVQVIFNLLTNAAKFTPRDGRIALRLRDEGGHIVIAVEDSGNGIAADLLPRVFDLFVQGEQPLDRRAGGLGLGLAIVRTLVAMHGGTVSAESGGAAMGSTFTVTLPAAGGAPPALAEASVAASAGRGQGRILVVDDNIDAAESLVILLRLAGYEAIGAAEGHEALEACETFDPDLAILDIGLPGMDGYELARRIRGSPRWRDIRLVALTGYGQPRDRQRAFEASFNEHLVKPVPPERLLAVVQQLIAGRPGRPV